LKAIIGLGNPGIKYEATRHNAGFEVLDHLSCVEFNSEQFKKNERLFSQIALIAKPNNQLLLAKPTTYMNDSGKSLLAIKNWYKLVLKDILVIHDDVSLPLGKIRLQKEGGAGGQHGIESIINSLGGNKGFNRLKIGVGPDPGGERRADYVLQKLKKEEKILLKEVIDLATEAIVIWLNAGIDQAMNQFNGLDICVDKKSETKKDTQNE
jgi:peptidyl-tRNA hydrolase, PTH1 family